MTCTQSEYHQIRKDIIADRSYKSDDERLTTFKEKYQNIIASEEGVAEWDIKFYPKYLKFESAFFLFFYILINVFVYFYVSDMIMTSLTLLGFMIFSPILLMFHPICYKHKFTKSGFYVLKYKKGKKARKVILALYLVLGAWCLVHLLYYMR